MRLGEPYMDESKRQDILTRISNGRTKESRVVEVISSLPAWAERPFQEDQEKVDQELKAFQQNDPVIRTLEMRLAQAPGPIWRELTPQEQSALSTWDGAIERLHAYVNTHFPSESQKYWANVALFVIGIGAFVAPLFLTADSNGPKLPFRLGPPALPPSMSPGARAPSSPSSIIRASSATPVRAEVFRPGTQTPWRRPQAEASTPAAPAFRAFARPLGPSLPLTPATVSAERITAAPAGSAHGARIYPRFRR